MSDVKTCEYCGYIHRMMCPRIKSIEYANGIVSRIEFHETWIRENNPDLGEDDYSFVRVS
jgi:hypothetical protein